MQTDGADFGSFRDEVSFTVSQYVTPFVTTASIIAKILHQEFRTPVSTRSDYARHKVAGTPKNTLQLVDYKRRRCSSYFEPLMRRFARSILRVLRQTVLAPARDNANAIFIIRRDALRFYLWIPRSIVLED